MKDITGQLLSNRYKIIEKIGTGGMAQVYKAYCNTLNRFVAVKIIKDELKNEAESIKRFRTESRAVSVLNHPNIVSVYDVGVFDGRPFIVMELIEGITLKEYMRQRKVLEVKEALYLVAQVLKALDHAHERNIIHRDVKPQNIMVLIDGIIKVADFGIARFTQSNTITMSDTAIGTAHYLSPEQAKGSVTDAKSDIYSVGVMLYEMLTGRLPFDSDNPVSVALMHINSEAQKPSELNPKIPEGLESVIMKAMARHPQDRYDSAKQMLTDLELIRNDPSITFDYVASADEDAPTRKININEETSDEENADEETKNRIMSIFEDDYDDEDEYDDEPVVKKPKKKKQAKPGKSRLPKQIAIAAVCAVAIIFVLVRFVLPMIFNEDENRSVEVPELEGLYAQQVLDEAQEKYPDFEIRIVQTITDENVPEGYIISQTPKADIKKRVGTVIELVVSAGDKMVIVDNVIGLEYRYAKQRLEEGGFIVSRVDEYSDTVTAENVISSNPEPGEEVAEGSNVELHVSLGREKVLIETPLVVGLNQDSAKNAVLASGMRIGEITQEISDAPQGEVIAQTIRSGTLVDENTALGFTVSLGKRYAEEFEVILPDEPEDQVVKITQNGETVYERSHSASDERVMVELEGTGTAMIGVYINDVLYYEKVVRFE